MIWRFCKDGPPLLPPPFKQNPPPPQQPQSDWWGDGAAGAQISMTCWEEPRSTGSREQKDVDVARNGKGPCQAGRLIGRRGQVLRNRK